MSDTQEQVSIREVQPVATRRADECPHGCTDKQGHPRIMRRVVNQSPRVQKQDDGSTKQVTVMVTVRICDKCGEQIRSEQVL